MAVALFFVAVSGPVAAAPSGVEKLASATTVVRDFVGIPENAIPPALLNQAYGVAVLPGVLKVGLVLGGRYGAGVLAVRDESGAWSNPCFITLTGGSIGWQIGGSSTDIILVFKSRRSVASIERGDFTLGGDASIAAGPVGRSASAATNLRFSAEVYSYSRARGLFAGISIEGAALAIDQATNAAFYDQPGIASTAILNRSDRSGLPRAARQYLTALTRYLPRPADF